MGGPRLGPALTLVAVVPDGRWGHSGLLLPFLLAAAVRPVAPPPHSVSTRALLRPSSHLRQGLTFREASLPPSSLQSHLLLGLPCLLLSAETRAPWPWQMCEAGGGTLSPDVIVFMFPESEGSELWTPAVGGGVVGLHPPAPTFPPPSSLLQPVYLARSFSEPFTPSPTASG